MACKFYLLRPCPVHSVTKCSVFDVQHLSSKLNNRYRIYDDIIDPASDFASTINVSTVYHGRIFDRCFELQACRATHPSTDFSQAPSVVGGSLYSKVPKEMTGYRFLRMSFFWMRYWTSCMTGPALTE